MKSPGLDCFFRCHSDPPWWRRISFLLAMVLLYPGCDLLLSPGPTELRLDSEPDGCSLTINGKDVGRTPYVLKQPVHGKYLLRFAKDGYEPMERVIEISAQSPAEMLTQLQRMRGLVLFESLPPGAEVSVNGIFKGKTPLLSTDLLSGTYRASFSLDGYDPREMEFEVADRSPKLCQINLKSNFVSLQVDSKPQGAAVIIDGIHKGQTPCTIEDILVGNHTLKLVKEGFKDYQDHLKLAQTTSGITPIVAQLEEQFAVLDVTSTPPEARVSVNGEFKGRTPWPVSNLRDGKYTITIEKLGYETVVREIEITRTQDSKLDVPLAKATGTLVLNILPMGCNVVVANSEHKGISTDTPYSIELNPGPCKIEVSKAGHAPQVINVNVELRKIVTHNATLKRIWVKDIILLLKSGQVVEGMFVGEYPDGTIRIEINPGTFGTYKLDEIQSRTPVKP